MNLDDASIFAVRKCQQPLVAPAAHLHLHPYQRDAQPRRSRIVRQRLAEFVERVQACLDRVLDTVFCDSALQPEVGETGAVGRLGKKLVGLVEQCMQCGHIADEQRPPPRQSSCSSRVSEKCVSQRFPPSRRRPVAAVLEGQWERRLRPRLACRTVQYLDEPDTLVVVCQALPARR